MPNKKQNPVAWVGQGASSRQTIEIGAQGKSGNEVSAMIVIGAYHEHVRLRQFRYARVISAWASLASHAERRQETGVTAVGTHNALRGTAVLADVSCRC